MENARAESEIIFYLLVSEDFDENDEKRVLKLCEKYNCDINIFSVGNRFRNVKTHIPWIKTPTYYRLLLPELLTDIDKCLYLDVDIVVLDDLHELYDIDISDHLVAGVYALGYQKSHGIEYCKQADLPALDQYINAGVLLMNLKMLREIDFSKRAMNLVKNNYPSQDQDIINQICYNKIKILPFKFNAMTKYYGWPDESYSPMYVIEDIHKAWNTPTVIHYADKKKPWRSLATPLASYWWFYCKKSGLWNYWIEQSATDFIIDGIFSKNEIQEEERKREGLYRLLQAEGIIIYGAGIIAKKIICKLLAYNIKIKYIAVSKEAENPSKIKDIPVKNIEKIDKTMTKYPVVIALSEYCWPEVISKLWENEYANIVVIDSRFL